jgi:hypothetical protein
VNYPAEAARLEQRVNSVKMMGAIWTDMRALDMWLSRQIKSPANRCLGLAPGGMEAASLACVNGPEHAWDIFKVAGTENHRIRNIKTRQCLAVKQRAEAAILVLDSCDGDISSGNIWNMSIGAAAIKNVAQPTQCLGTTPNQEVGLLTCPATSLPLMP